MTLFFIFKEKLQEKRDEEEQQIIPANSDLHIYDDQVAICLETKSKDLQVNTEYLDTNDKTNNSLLSSSSSSSHLHENISFVQVMPQ